MTRTQELGLPSELNPTGNHPDAQTEPQEMPPPALPLASTIDQPPVTAVPWPT
jgi:hypothetical protein